MVLADDPADAGQPPRRRAEIARPDRVSGARVTRIKSLLDLAPDIREIILFLARTEQGRDLIREHVVRPIVAILDWRKQRRTWREELAEPESR